MKMKVCVLAVCGLLRVVFLRFEQWGRGKEGGGEATNIPCSTNNDKDSEKGMSALKSSVPWMQWDYYGCRGVDNWWQVVHPDYCELYSLNPNDNGRTRQDFS